MELSAKQVQAVSQPGWHRVAPQLYLVIKASGARSWVFRLTVNGRATWRGLGSCARISFADAKAKAEEMRSAIYFGKFDPTRPAPPAACPVFADFAEQYILENESSWRWHRAGQAWRTSLATHAKGLSKLPLRGITAIDVKAALLGRDGVPGVWLTNPSSANKIRGRIERILDAARVAGHRTGPNPATWKGQLSHALPPLSTANAKHHSAVPVAEIPVLAAELVRRDSLSAKSLLFTILCACRTGDTIGATWAEIDLEAKAWNIPKGRTKAGRPFRIPLADHAVKLLAALNRDEDYVFAKPNGKPLSNMAMLEVMRKLRGMGATVHGLRSSFKDWATEQGFADELSEAALDHSGSDKVRAAYARSDLFEQRRGLANAWAAHAMGTAPGPVRTVNPALSASAKAWSDAKRR